MSAKKLSVALVLLLVQIATGFAQTDAEQASIYKKMAELNKQTVVQDSGKAENSEVSEQPQAKTAKTAAKAAQPAVKKVKAKAQAKTAAAAVKVAQPAAETSSEPVAVSLASTVSSQGAAGQGRTFNRVSLDDNSLNNILALRSEIDSILRVIEFTQPAAEESAQDGRVDELAMDLTQLRGTVDEIRSRSMSDEAALLDNIKVNSQFEMSLYGFVKLEAFYDNTEVAKGDWLLFAMPGNSAQASQNIFSMNARHLRIGSKIKGPEIGTDGRVNALVEVDFAGGFPNSSTAARQAQLRLRHAWVELNFPRWEARFGQDWALIAGPFPNTTSFVVGAGKGNLWMRYPQIKGTIKFNKAKFSLSINRPMDGNVKYDSYAGGSFDIVGDGERTGLPWVMWRQWVDVGPAQLSVSGHYGKERIPDLQSNAHTLSTYSFNADAVIKGGPLTFTARGFYGQNLNSFFGGVFQGFTANDFSVHNVEARGGWAQAVYKFHPKWSVTAGGGMDDPLDSDLNTGMRSRNDWIFANLAFNPIKPLVFMLEAEQLKTSYLGNEAGTNNRIQFVTYFHF